MCDSCDAVMERQDRIVKGVKETLLAVQNEASAETRKIADSIAALKHERIVDQKKILDLQRRLGFAMEEYEQDKTKLVGGDTLMGVDLNSEENNMKCKADDIMVTLKDRILAAAHDNVKDPETNRFINKISMSTSPKGSVESPKRFEASQAAPTS